MRLDIILSTRRNLLTDSGVSSKHSRKEGRREEGNEEREEGTREREGGRKGGKREEGIYQVKISGKYNQSCYLHAFFTASSLFFFSIKISF